jgi:hypothetical protein
MWRSGSARTHSIVDDDDLASFGRIDVVTREWRSPRRFRGSR